MFGWLRRAPPPLPTEQQLRLVQALADYPLYSPPEFNPGPTLEARRSASEQYREYFLGSTQTRLEALRGLLADFDISLDLDDAGLMAVSSWLPQWADLLVDFGDQTVGNAYHQLAVPWTGKLVGLNVIFDLGIYHAECLWIRRTKLDWIVIHRGLDVHGNHTVAHFIRGLPYTNKWFNPIHYMYLHCWNIWMAKKQKQPSYESWSLKSDSFYRHVLANTPPGRRSRKGTPHKGSA